MAKRELGLFIQSMITQLCAQSNSIQSDPKAQVLSIQSPWLEFFETSLQPLKLYM